MTRSWAPDPRRRDPGGAGGPLPPLPPQPQHPGRPSPGRRAWSRSPRWLAQTDDPRAAPEAQAARFVDPEEGFGPGPGGGAGRRGGHRGRGLAHRAEVRAVAARAGPRGGLAGRTGAPGQEGERTKFEDYYDHREPVARLPSHRFLAMSRGEREEVLRRSAGAAGGARRSLFYRTAWCAARAARGAGAAGGRAGRPASACWPPPSRRNPARPAGEGGRGGGASVRRQPASAAAGRRRRAGGRCSGWIPASAPAASWPRWTAPGKLPGGRPPSTRTKRRADARRCRGAEAATRLVQLVKAHGIRLVAVGNGTAGRETDAAFVRRRALRRGRGARESRPGLRSARRAPPSTAPPRSPARSSPSWT